MKTVLIQVYSRFFGSGLGFRANSVTLLVSLLSLSALVPFANAQTAGGIQLGTKLKVVNKIEFPVSTELSADRGVMPGQVGNIIFYNGQTYLPEQWEQKRVTLVSPEYCELGVALLFPSTLPCNNEKEVSTFWKENKIILEINTLLQVTSQDPEVGQPTYSEYIRLNFNEEKVNGRYQQSRSTLSLQCYFSAGLTPKEQEKKLKAQLGSALTFF